jgi:hypothetical protein
MSDSPWKARARFAGQLIPLALWTFAAMEFPPDGVAWEHEFIFLMFMMCGPYIVGYDIGYSAGKAAETDRHRQDPASPP